MSDNAYRAVRLLRGHRILSIIDYIFGLDEETPRKHLAGLPAAFTANDRTSSICCTGYALLLDGHRGERCRGTGHRQRSLSNWDCRHAIVAQSKLTPAQLMLGAELVEGIYHLHPKRLWRAATATDYDLRRHFRFAYGHVVGVFWGEIGEFLRNGWRVKKVCRFPRPPAESRF